MTLDEFGKALDRYGGDLTRWPDALRTDAEALTARDAGAAALVAQATRLDGLLAEAMQPMPVDAALIGRIVAGIDDRVHHEIALRPTPRLAAWAGVAMLAFLSVGYAAGLMLPASQGEDTFAGLMFGSGWTTESDATDAGSLL